ncbi:MAG: hypothetical protein BWK79_10535 [Beggiatoa sp. IS2]|nr:MAG: hypothetical protein BWK79_10535 [Beggiatoa sp. IS2]
MTMLKLSHFFKSRSASPLKLPQSLVLTQKRVYILPTRQGWLFALIVVVMLLGSMNYNNNLGYGFSFLLISMALVNMLHTHRNLLGLRIEVGKVAPVFVGEMAQFQLWLDNRHHSARIAIKWQVFAEKFPEFSLLKWQPPESKIIPPVIVDVAAQQRVNVILTKPAYQRGYLPLGEIMVSTCFPLGLFQAWSYPQLDFSATVYPFPAGQKTLPLGQQAENCDEGSPQIGGGEDFMGYRDYQIGDSPRHVDWKAVARRQEWLIKQFGGMGLSTVWLTWDAVNHLNHIEKALSQLCLWILIAESQGAHYGLKLPGIDFEPTAGEIHRQRCLESLAFYGLNRDL